MLNDVSELTDKAIAGSGLLTGRQLTVNTPDRM
jgi:hypothetical protein